VRSSTLRRRRSARLVAACGTAGVLAASIVAPSPVAAQPTCPPSTKAEAPRPTEIPWHLRRMNPQSVWPLTRGGGVTVAVLDSGVTATHEFLEGRVAQGRDFGVLADHAGQCDAYYHGTMVAGIIAGRDGLDGVAARGIAPEATILPGRVTLDRSGDDELVRNVPGAVDWAVEQGADVINLSLTSPPNPALEEAVANAVANDVVLVAAIGNVERSEDGQLLDEQNPALAAYPGVIAVVAVDEAGNPSESPDTGGKMIIDVAAPGVDIWGPMPRGGYAMDTGTSFATPIVSGVAALVRAKHPDLTAEQVADRIIRTADRAPEERDIEVGYGVVNPYRAVTATLGTRPNPPADELALPPPEPDPLASARRIAAWAALCGVVIAGLLLLAPPAIRRGRERHWRPART
jgi:membrane-anchored mycosin MYCP